jgi:hypothetical protein
MKMSPLPFPGFAEREFTYSRFSGKSHGEQLALLKKSDYRSAPVTLMNSAESDYFLDLEAIHAAGRGFDFIEATILSKIGVRATQEDRSVKKKLFSLLDSACTSLAGSGPKFREQKDKFMWDLRLALPRKNIEEEVAIGDFLRGRASRACGLAIDVAHALEKGKDRDGLPFPEELAMDFFCADRLEDKAASLGEEGLALSPGNHLSLEKLCTRFCFPRMWEERLSDKSQTELAEFLSKPSHANMPGGSLLLFYLSTCRDWEDMTHPDSGAYSALIEELRELDVENLGRVLSLSTYPAAWRNEENVSKSSFEALVELHENHHLRGGDKSKFGPLYRKLRKTLKKKRTELADSLLYEPFLHGPKPWGLPAPERYVLPCRLW